MSSLALQRIKFGFGKKGVAKNVANVLG